MYKEREREINTNNSNSNTDNNNNDNSRLKAAITRDADLRRLEDPRANICLRSSSALARATDKKGWLRP